MELTREESDEILLQAHTLMLEYGSRIQLTKREMDIFEMGVYLGTEATVQWLDSKRRIRR